jgi:hypothetical protein
VRHRKKYNNSSGFPYQTTRRDRHPGRKPVRKNNINNMINKMDPRDVYRTFLPTTAEGTFFFKCIWNNLPDRSC